MNIKIFNQLTTEEALLEIEKQSSNYDELYVDMEDAEQRKFVKGKASLITDLLKKLDRARIDIAKSFKLEVEDEASKIKERLELANKPFTALIEAHKEKRAKILADKKAKEEALELARQIEEDHENAITLDKIRTFEIQEAIKAQKERDEQIAKEAREEAERQKELAEERAEQAEKDRILAEAKAKRDAEEAEKRAIEAKRQAEIEKKEAEKRAIEAKRQAEIEKKEAEKRAIEAEKQRQQREIDAERERIEKLEANKKHVGAVRCEIKKCIMVHDIDEAKAKKIVLSLIKHPRITVNY